MIANAVASAATPSASASGGSSGGPSGSPFSAAKPLIASASVPKPGAPRVRPGLPEAADAREHEPRVGGRRARPARAPSARACPGGSSRARTSARSARRRKMSRPSGCERSSVTSRLLRPSVLNQSPTPSLRRAVAARRVGTARVLDLDHVRAVVAEQHPGERRGEERRRLDDADALERLSQVDRQAEADPRRALQRRRRAAASARTPAAAGRRRRTSRSPRPASRSRP